jgi:hypothetical protein
MSYESVTTQLSHLVFIFKGGNVFHYIPTDKDQLFFLVVVALGHSARTRTNCF